MIKLKDQQLGKTSDQPLESELNPKKSTQPVLQEEVILNQEPEREVGERSGFNRNNGKKLTEPRRKRKRRARKSQEIILGKKATTKFYETNVLKQWRALMTIFNF